MVVPKDTSLLHSDALFHNVISIILEIWLYFLKYENFVFGNYINI